MQIGQDDETSRRQVLQITDHISETIVGWGLERCIDLDVFVLMQFQNVFVKVEELSF